MRFAAVLTLVLLAPFTGELLLGNLPADPAGWAVMLIPLILLYGGGALLIREVARRLGRGYPTMLLLAIAYGLIEERSEEHTSELQSRGHLVCRLLLEKKNTTKVLRKIPTHIRTSIV